MPRLRHILAIGAAMTTMWAAPTSAQFAGWITGCAENPVGSKACPAREVGDFMAELPVGYLDTFKQAGMESYAMEDSLRHMGGAIADKARNGGCRAVPNATHALAVWQDNSQVPGNATDLQTEALSYFEAIVSNSLTYVRKGC